MSNCVQYPHDGTRVVSGSKWPDAERCFCSAGGQHIGTCHLVEIDGDNSGCEVDRNEKNFYVLCMNILLFSKNSGILLPWMV